MTSRPTADEFRVRQLGTRRRRRRATGVSRGRVAQAPPCCARRRVAGFVVRIDAAAQAARACGHRAGRAHAPRAVHGEPSARDARAHRCRARCRRCNASSIAVSGVVVEELGDVLTWIRSGMGRGGRVPPRRRAHTRAGGRADVPTARGGRRARCRSRRRLVALSEDLRDARREQLHKDAVRRRAAMLVPTIAILAPIMLLFIAAPLPSIVLGHR